MSRPLRIAVADDEPDVLDYYQIILPRLGHEVVAAARSGRELIEQCRAARPDLVITDIQMPDMDGISAAAEVYRVAPVPIILASAHHSEELIRRAEAAPILAYLVKPVRAADFSPALAIAQRRFDELGALRHLSLTDELTGLHNRRGFLMLAEQQVRSARRRREGLSLLFVDVDGLKAVNDMQGHPAGDRLLRATADVLRQTFRGSDLLARLGGDEYCVLVVDDPGGGAAAAVQRLLQNVAAYNARQGREALSLSVGAVEIDPASDLRVEEDLARADEVMYEQKQRKRALRAPHHPFGPSPAAGIAADTP